MNRLPSVLAPLVTSHLLLHAALLTPPSVLSHARLAAAFLPLIWSCHFYTWRFGYGYMALVHALWATELLLFRDPREDFALLHFGTSSSPPIPAIVTAVIDEKLDGSEEDIVDVAAAEDKDTPKRKEKKPVTTNDSYRIAWAEFYPEEWWKRFVWVTKLIVSLRYISWTTSDSQTVLYSSQPPPPRRSRIAFILQKLLLIGICIGITDVTNFYQYFDPYMQIETSIDEAFPRRLGGFFARHHLKFLSPRFVRIAVLGLQQSSIFTLLGAIPAVVFAVLGGVGLVDEFWGRVENWPSIIGSPVAISQKGLRGLWGGCWHQLFRQILTGPGKALSRTLRLPKISTLSYAIDIIVAFGLSSAVHSATMPRDYPTISPLRFASFFWMHGACILIEIILVRGTALLGLNGPKPLWACAALGLLRVMWTGLVLYHTVPVYQDELTRVARVFGLKTVLFIPFPK